MWNLILTINPNKKGGLFTDLQYLDFGLSSSTYTFRYN
ncbi:hypothetical protein SAMN05443667_10883 [Flavobacterium gillisiae]|uniref:Uncharacterized protein n=1 Tax=Flavobacterium gillisiae TaxID=150146 RepID=A0A1H4DSH7_9FLAO|nr:hypothetical protein SAMN05443667_10883 [Flavobacterium gillisiae]